MYLKVVGVPSSPKITFPKNIDFYYYGKTDAADQDKGGLIIMGVLVQIFIPWHMRRILEMTERIMFPWEGR